MVLVREWFPDQNQMEISMSNLPQRIDLRERFKRDISDSAIDWHDAVRLALKQFDDGFTPETILDQAFGINESDYEMDLLDIIAAGGE